MSDIKIETKVKPKDEEPWVNPYSDPTQYAVDTINGIKSLIADDLRGQS